MKKLVVLSKSLLIIILAMMLSLTVQAQDFKAPIYNYQSEQYQTETSSLFLAYHDLREYQTLEEDMDIDDILFFIDESVKKGTLIGKGSGSIADARLNALVQKIESADETLSNGGSFEEVCQNFLDIYLLTDGLNQPTDFVLGPGSKQLAEKINYFSAEIIGCDW